MKQPLLPVTAPTRDPHINGYFDAIADECASGWACDRTQPDKRLIIEILCDEEVVARGEANQFREDLLAMGMGDGQYRFVLPLSYELFD